MRLLRAILFLLCWSAGAALAQYPNKAIRLVVPFPPGGSADVAARIVATPLSQALGQTIIIDNKAGADGLIAGELVAKSPPDGYTFLFATSTGINAAPAMRKTVPYDPIADFTPIGRVGTFGFFLFVHESVPAKNVQELLAYVRTNPKKLNYGTGNGTSIVATAQLAQLANLDMVHVPYKGDAPLLVDILAGRVHMMFAAGQSLAQAKDGRLRVVATMLPTRSALVPDAPTLPEAGINGLNATPWGGFLGPANLPRDIVQRMSRELAIVMNRPDVREQLGKLAFEAQASTAEEFGAFVREQLGVWRKAVKDAGIQPE